MKRLVSLEFSAEKIRVGPNYPAIEAINSVGPDYWACPKFGHAQARSLAARFDWNSDNSVRPNYPAIEAFNSVGPDYPAIEAINSVGPNIPAIEAINSVGPNYGSGGYPQHTQAVMP